MNLSNFKGVYLKDVKQSFIKKDNSFKGFFKNTLIFFDKGSGLFKYNQENLDYTFSQIIVANNCYEINPITDTSVYILEVENSFDILNTGIITIADNDFHTSFYMELLSELKSGITDIYLHSSKLYSYLMGINSELNKPKVKYSVIVNRSIDIIHSEYSSLASVESIADQLAISKHHLIREFSHSVGTTPGKYLEDIRLSRSQLLLRCSDYKLELIANMVGFSNGNYFGKVFKKAFKITPKVYRSKYHSKYLTDEEKSLLEKLESIYFV